jgi:hypothetical protein
MTNHENSAITWLGLLTRPKACPFDDGEIQGIRSKQELRNINLRNRDSPSAGKPERPGERLDAAGTRTTCGLRLRGKEKNCPRPGLRTNGQQHVDEGLGIFWPSFPKLMAALG